jgi:hypothetical protein
VLTVGVTSHNNTVVLTAGRGYASQYTAGSAGTLTEVKFEAPGGVSGPVVTGLIYADNAGVPGSLLASSSQVTDVLGGINTLTLSSPLAISNGQVLWIGLQVLTVGVTIYNTSGTGTNYRWTDTGAPDNPPGSLTSTTNQLAVWAVGTSGGQTIRVAWQV